MPDAGFSSSSGAKGGLLPLLLMTLAIVVAAIGFVVTVVLPS